MFWFVPVKKDSLNEELFISSLRFGIILKITPENKGPHLYKNDLFSNDYFTLVICTSVMRVAWINETKLVIIKNIPLKCILCLSVYSVNSEEYFQISGKHTK